MYISNKESPTSHSTKPNQGREENKNRPLLLDWITQQQQYQAINVSNDEQAIKHQYELTVYYGELTDSNWI
ncbi:hypothetical protein BLA29_008279 [Euroglyphus maynei]|uniref:Uncharacterized protein n=1 Tax=Euroglyphus maynei TaxID=6958 RepID=A0A1Y3BBQ0_EURMA|nr:hypothetical protein BLA29_008279 [Euroglyphus maynei]